MQAAMEPLQGLALSESASGLVAAPPPTLSRVIQGCWVGPGTHISLTKAWEIRLRQDLGLRRAVWSGRRQNGIERALAAPPGPYIPHLQEQGPVWDCVKVARETTCKGPAPCLAQSSPHFLESLTASHRALLEGWDFWSCSVYCAWHIVGTWTQLNMDWQPLGNTAKHLLFLASAGLESGPGKVRMLIPGVLGTVNGVTMSCGHVWVGSGDHIECFVKTEESCRGVGTWRYEDGFGSKDPQA